MNAISQGHSEFTARIARIESGAAASKQLLFVGTDEVYHVPLKVRKVQVTAGERLFRGLGVLFETGYAVILGAAAHGVALIAEFILQGVPQTPVNADADLLVQVGIGLVIATVAGALLGIRWRSLVLAKTIGVVASVLLLHNAVHLFPDVFEALTSRPWVDQILAHTRAHSILWRGVSIPL
jgi:hypothetical protein